MSPHATRTRASRAPAAVPAAAAAAATKTAIAIAVALAAIGASACKEHIECTAEVTEGAGTFKGTAKGEKVDERLLRREAVRDACIAMCAPPAGTASPGGEGNEKSPAKGCVGRCLADGEAGKVGVKTQCAEPK